MSHPTNNTIRHEPSYKQHNKTWTLLQTTGGTDEPYILNKTWTLLQTTGGTDKPNILNKTWTLLQTTGGTDEPNIVILLGWDGVSFLLIYRLSCYNFNVDSPLWTKHYSKVLSRTNLHNCCINLNINFIMCSSWLF